MFEEMTFNKLLQDKLETVSNKYDKREGSIIYDALAPNSAEDAQVYLTLAWMFLQQHGETADRENLIKIAYDTRGILPKSATHAELKGVFNTEIEIGTRFSCESLNYTVTEQLGVNTYRLECETAGTEGNKYLGKLIPIEYIPGLRSAELIEVLVYAQDEEDTETFRQRWRDAFDTTAYGGNKADYKEKIGNINGVGGVKVERATTADGEIKGGYVRCTIISSNYDVPSEELIEEIQTIIDPEVNHGEGDGVAPIGHHVTIQACKSHLINVSTMLMYDDGYEYTDLAEQINNAIDTYFMSLAKTWVDNKNGLIVRISLIESALLAIPGVIDITDTMLNGAEENITLDVYSIPVRGEVSA